MSRSYKKTITREIRKSFGRFAAIIAIVALGVCFLVGILSSTPDMKATADQYYRDYAMSDYDIKSTLGFTDKDISALSKIPEVSEVMPANVMDTLIILNDEQITGRLYGLDFDNLTINKLQLVEGRMPENKTECVIENPNTYMKDVSIGDTIKLSEDNDDLKDTYTRTEFKVVGIVDNPYYFCNCREPASVGTGHADVIIYTGISAFKADVYTDLFILTANTNNAFSDKYENYIDKVTEKIEAVSEERIPARHQEVISEATSELQEAKDKLADKKAEVNAELADAERELSNGQKEYDDGVAQLEAAKKEIKSGRDQIAAARQQLADSKAQLTAGKDQMDPAQYQAQMAELEATEKQLDTREAELDAAEDEIGRNERELTDAAAELASGRAELADGRAEAEAEFTDAESEIADAEKEIAEIEEPEWFILDRNSNASYARFSIDVEKVADIATVFPVFFFLIAALVSLTTMTRMVEEERIQIGTLKALGYRRMTIMSKYLIYCGAATVIGCIIGLLAGFQIIPRILFAIFGSQYVLPPLITEIHPVYAVVSCVLEVICTLGATWAACRYTLREKAAQLMIPRAPKAGKRILIERIRPLWKRLSFSHKSTIRNVFRYKKHMFMTIIGIAGCTALMVAGYGIQDSLTKLVHTQFDDILKYDMQIELTDSKSDKILNDFLKDKDHMVVLTRSMDLESTENDEKISSTLYVPDDPDALKDFITLQERRSGDAVEFNDDSVIITEKMADILEVSAGDTVTLTDSDGKSAEFTLSGVTENYAGCYIYMAPEVYSSGFDEDIEYNSYLVKSEISGTEAQDKTAAQLQESDNVSSVSFTSQSREIYEIIMDSLTMLVYVLILFSGMLAAVVLYNLTNININERTRELATLRVLGYHHGEVGMYIFREIGILTVMGTAVGLVLGKILHHYIILIAESPDMVFGRELEVSTYIKAALFTLIFSAIVDALMSIKLKKIDMAASMKAVD